MSADGAFERVCASMDSVENGEGWRGTRDSYCERMLGLLHSNRSSLIKYLRRMRLATEDAEDVLQETCIRLLNAPESWRGERCAYGFIYKVARNLARDELRRRQRRQHQMHCSVEDVELACDAPHPADCLEQTRSAEELSRVLARLTPRCQKVVDLHYAHNMSFRRIATQLGVSKKTIERDLNLARDYCHAVLQRAS